MQSLLFSSQSCSNWRDCLQALLFIQIFYCEDFFILVLIFTCYFLQIFCKFFCLLQSMSLKDLFLSFNRIKLTHQLQVYKTDKIILWWHELQVNILVIISFVTRNTQSSSSSSKASSLLLHKHRQAIFLISNSALFTEYSFSQDWIIYQVSLNHIVINLHWLLLLILLNDSDFLIFWI